MLNYHSNFAVILIYLALLIVARVGQKEQYVAVELYSEQKFAGNALPTKPSHKKDSLTLTYIANMGVLLQTRDSKILIDCLFDGPTKARYPSSQTIDSMVNGIPPFDNIDLVLVTHKDPDHFDSAVVARYMEIRQEPILVLPADAAEKLHAAKSDWSDIQSRVVVVDLEIGQKLDTVLANIHITIFSTTHGTSNYPMNLMYVVEPDGWRVFHDGDWSGKIDDFLQFGLVAAPLDLAIVGYAWPLSPNPDFPRLLREVLNPYHIALGHVSIAIEGTAEERIKDVRKYYHDIFALLPGMPAKVFYK